MPPIIYFDPLIEDVQFVRAPTLHTTVRKEGWGGGGGVGDGGVDQDSASGDLCSSKYGTFYSLGFEKRQVAFQ